jgi:hypothetical protein
LLLLLRLLLLALVFILLAAFVFHRRVLSAYDACPYSYPISIMRLATGNEKSRIPKAAER